MNKAVILHGTLGSPEGNWFLWLKQQLEARGFEVWLPQLPHAEQPSLEEWHSFVSQHCPFPIDGDTLVVGHSSGAILALILIQRSRVRIGSVVCVSVFHDNSLNWQPNARLFDVPFEWEEIRTRKGKLLFVHSDNDPYVPLDQANFVVNNCQAELIVVPGQGHFNLEQSPAYQSFPHLLEICDRRQMAS